MLPNSTLVSDRPVTGSMAATPTRLNSKFAPDFPRTNFLRLRSSIDDRQISKINSRTSERVTAATRRPGPARRPPTRTLI
jgi:hypothetical protein